MLTTVTAIYSTRNLAERAVGQLVSEGFTKDHISLVMSTTPEASEIVHEETEDTVRGAITGAVVGGGFAAILVGALSLPGVGLVVAGPLVGSLAAGGAGAALGTVLGAILGKGMSEQTATEYMRHVGHGEILIGVDTEHARVRLARDVLERTGGKMISDSVHLEGQLHHREHYLDH